MTTEERKFREAVEAVERDRGQSRLDTEDRASVAGCVHVIELIAQDVHVVAVADRRIDGVVARRLALEAIADDIGPVRAAQENG